MSDRKKKLMRLWKTQGKPEPRLSAKLKMHSGAATLDPSKTLMVTFGKWFGTQTFRTYEHAPNKAREVTSDRWRGHRTFAYRSVTPIRIMAGNSPQKVQYNLEFGLREAMGNEQLKRESWWTEGLAAGRTGFLEKIRPMIPSRMELKIEEEQEGLWVLKEMKILELNPAS